MIGVVYPYLKRVGISLSVLLNVLLGGDSNQAFSARNHLWKRQGKFNLCIPIDFMLGKDHCLMSWVYWISRKQ
jgi:hypothetical protein